MARIRTVKPEYWTSEQVMALSHSARLFFIGLWNFCDDAGHIPYAPKTLKVRIFPGDDCVQAGDICGYVDQLLLPDRYGNSLVALYEFEGQQYLKVMGWQHQRIEKPQKAKYPPPPAGWVPDRSRTTPGMVREQPSTDRIGKEGRGKDRMVVEGEPVENAGAFPTGQQKKAENSLEGQEEQGSETELLYSTGLAAYMALTMKRENAARVEIGAIVRQIGVGPTLDVITSCQLEQPANPLTYIQGRIAKLLAPKPAPKAPRRRRAKETA